MDLLIVYLDLDLIFLLFKQLISKFIFFRYDFLTFSFKFIWYIYCFIEHLVLKFKTCGLDGINDSILKCYHPNVAVMFYKHSVTNCM